MYTRHFNLQHKPFSLIPGGDDVYFSSGHLSAFSTLEFGLLEQVGITVITGEVGAGKTTLIRHLLGRINYDQLTVGLIDTVHRSYGTLLSWIITAFRIETDSDRDGVLLKTLQDFLVRQYASGKRTVVIVDEAQNMSKKDLESLRLLTNINTDRQQLLQVVLVGQPELLDKFRHRSMSQLAQRVSAECHLGPLDMPETMQYIRHRVEVAGGAANLFNITSIMGIYYFSGGIPRIINTLCDGCLVFAYGRGSQTVDLNILMEVVRAKQLGGIHRMGIDTDPRRENVRHKLLHSEGVDLLELVGRGA